MPKTKHEIYNSHPNFLLGLGMRRGAFCLPASPLSWDLTNPYLFICLLSPKNNESEAAQNAI